LLTIYSPLSSQVLRTFVTCATTSIALASRLLGGLNRVMSPVAAGIATVGQAVRVVRMPGRGQLAFPRTAEQRERQKSGKCDFGVDHRHRVLKHRREPNALSGWRDHRKRLSRLQAME
jgi:hypothetical protein